MKDNDTTITPPRGASHQRWRLSNTAGSSLVVSFVWLAMSADKSRYKYVSMHARPNTMMTITVLITGPIMLLSRGADLLK
jgi:hypothetical protein